MSLVKESEGGKRERKGPEVQKTSNSFPRERTRVKLKISWERIMKFSWGVRDSDPKIQWGREWWRRVEDFSHYLRERSQEVARASEQSPKIDQNQIMRETSTHTEREPRERGRSCLLLRRIAVKTFSHLKEISAAPWERQPPLLHNESPLPNTVRCALREPLIVFVLNQLLRPL